MPDQTYQPYQSIDDSQRQPSESAQSDASASTLSHGSRVIQPAAKDPAVEMIRQKIQNLYADEPNAEQEIVEAEHHTRPGSKHQQFMSGLQASGRSLAEIQAAWHSYYIDLSNNEKYEVWQEFYVQNAASPVAQMSQPAPIVARTAVQAPIADQFANALATQQTINPLYPQPTAAQSPGVGTTPTPTPEAVQHRIGNRHRAAQRAAGARSPHGEKAQAIKQRIAETVKTAAEGGKGKLARKHHIQSALFGLGFGCIVLFFFLFSFFNEVIIAPFIQPSRSVNNTPVIVDTAAADITGGTKVIIPKINLEIPVDYSQTTTSESAIELALDNGVVHYPTTVKPGETGNAAYFGHSSNNIFNPGKYKFAFVLLHELSDGDLFYLNYGGKTYAYKVFSKKIVTPQQVDVLDAIPGQTATATLITCDPPGTSINRLVVVGQQISPDPNTNGQPTGQTATTNTSPATTVASSSLPGNGPSLWSRIVKNIF